MYVYLDVVFINYWVFDEFCLENPKEKQTTLTRPDNFYHLDPTQLYRWSLVPPTVKFPGSATVFMHLVINIKTPQLANDHYNLITNFNHLNGKKNNVAQN